MVFKAYTNVLFDFQEEYLYKVTQAVIHWLNNTGRKWYVSHGFRNKIYVLKSQHLDPCTLWFISKMWCHHISHIVPFQHNNSIFNELFFHKCSSCTLNPVALMRRSAAADVIQRLHHSGGNLCWHENMFFCDGIHICSTLMWFSWTLWAGLLYERSLSIIWHTARR